MRSPRNSTGMVGLSILAAMMAGTSLGGMPNFGPTEQDRRNDPNREKTPEDLARIAKAEEKRRRKATARQSKGTDNQRGS